MSVSLVWWGNPHDREGYSSMGPGIKRTVSRAFGGGNHIWSPLRIDVVG